MSSEKVCENHTRRKSKVYYATQVDTCPPTFLLFVNAPYLFAKDYRRYVENAFRQSLDFQELPLRVLYRPRPRDSGRQGAS